jgi:hypothetical protein
VPQKRREAAYQYVALVDELKKTGKLTRRIDDHAIRIYV